MAGGESGTPFPFAVNPQKPPKNKDSSKARSSFVTTAVYHPLHHAGRQSRPISMRFGTLRPRRRRCFNPLSPPVTPQKWHPGERRSPHSLAGQDVPCCRPSSSGSTACPKAGRPRHRRRRRPDSELASFIARRDCHSPPAEPLTATGFPRRLRIIPLLDGRTECVHVDMDDIATVLFKGMNPSV